MIQQQNRGLTLVEVAITIVVAGILAFPVMFVIYQIAVADGRALERVEALHEARVLAERMRQLARDARGRISSLEDAFEFRDGQRTMDVYYYGTNNTRTLMATVTHDPGTQEMRLLDYRETTPVQSVVARGVTSARFDWGPSLSTTGTGRYGNYALGTNKRSFVLDVEVVRGNATHAQRMLFHAPNVR